MPEKKRPAKKRTAKKRDTKTESVLEIKTRLEPERALAALNFALEMADDHVSQSGSDLAEDVRTLCRDCGIADYRKRAMDFLGAAGVEIEGP